MDVAYASTTASFQVAHANVWHVKVVRILGVDFTGRGLTVTRNGHGTNTIVATSVSFYGVAPR